jgi:hypothetical protein
MADVVFLSDALKNMGGGGYFGPLVYWNIFVWTMRVLSKVTEN